MNGQSIKALSEDSLVSGMTYGFGDDINKVSNELAVTHLENTVDLLNIVYNIDIKFTDPQRTAILIAMSSAINHGLAIGYAHEVIDEGAQAKP